MRPPSQPTLNYEAPPQPRPRWWWYFLWSPGAQWLWVKVTIALVIGPLVLWLVVSAALFMWHLGPAR